VTTSSWRWNSCPTAFPDLAAAGRILQDTRSTNSGLIVDAWHWARAGTTAADLDSVPADKIVAVQLCDVQETPMDPLRTESLGYRLPPGDGCGDTVGMVRALQDKHVEPWVVTTEVISGDLISQGVDRAARAVASAAGRVLDQCRKAS
jgi:sugar phosphate isomerase/epimerase